MRDMAQDLFERFAGFVRGHTTSDRAHPGVGVGFIIAALVVLVLGFRWFTDDGGVTDSSGGDQSWALDVSSDGPTTTIGASPEAVAVRVGTAVPRGAEEDPSVTIGIPGTSLEIEIPLGPTTTTGPGTSGGGATGGGPTTGGNPGTTPTTRRPPTTTDPPTTEPPTTEPPPTTDPPTTEPPTTETLPTEPGLLGLSLSTDPSDASDGSDGSGGGLGGVVDGLLAGLDLLL